MRYRDDAECVSDIERDEFCYRRDPDGRVKWLFFWPWNSSAPLAAAIHPQRNALGASWRLTGSLERPTMEPSVDATGVWHGFIIDGSAIGQPESKGLTP